MSPPIDRRAFVRHSTAAVGLGTGAWWSMLRDAVERSRRQDKPVLTETTFNAYVKTVRSRGPAASQEFVTAVRTDVRRMLRDRFVLTSLQDRAINALTASNVSTIIDAVEHGFTGANEFRLRMPATAGGGECGLRSERIASQLASGATAEVWSIVVSQ